MDRANQELMKSAAPASECGLRLVSSGLRLAAPFAAPDPEWDAAFGKLLDWLGVAVDPVPAPRSVALRRMTGWARSAAGLDAAPRFAPWQVISPVALQQGGSPDLPRAEWLASYLFDSGPGGTLRSATIDLMLLSPHPAVCTADEAGAVPLPRLAIIEAMLRAARAEGRGRIAIIVPARDRNALARQLQCADRELTREGLALDILAAEQALPALMLAQPRWDAMIVMPELRSIVFALLAEATGIRAPWPALWHGPRGPVLFASEALSEAGARLPLDAPVLVQALVLALDHAGMASAAHRLSEASVRLRDNGVVTPSRGSAAPYVTTRSDAAFVDMICDGLGLGNRAVPQWRALGAAPTGGTTQDPVRLYIVT